MAIVTYKGITPKIAPGVFVAASADIIGDVTIEEGSTIWYGTVIRGDVAPVRIGKNVSVQENSTIHVDADIPTIIGNNVTIGHNVIVHAATIEDNCLIGMGSIILDSARIGKGSQVGAGALVPPRKEVAPRTLVVGMPCKPVKELTAEDEQGFIEHALRYVELAKDYL
jgi:carbonic anhydrase/acetyltransferase-like protein (isoleucine patch superfamily)